VDLNRNFGWDWGGQGSSQEPSDEEYAGTGPFSEREAQGLLKVLTDGNFDVFLSLHSGIRQVSLVRVCMLAWTFVRACLDGAHRLD